MRLELDPENPRLDRTLSQSEILVHFAEDPKFRKLAADIASSGLNPLESRLVVPVKGKSLLYRVMEGNRRVAAVKLLFEPELAGQERYVTIFKRLSAESKIPLPSTIPCVLLDNDEEAFHWMRVRHGGEQGGTGIQPWGPQEVERFNRRIGKRGQNSLAHALLEYAKTKKIVDETVAAAVPITSLTRLVNDKTVRAELGMRVDDEALATQLKVGNLNRVIKNVLTALASGATKVDQIYSQESRTKYIRQVLRDEGISEDRFGRSSIRLDAGAAAASLGSISSNRTLQRTKRRSIDRKTLVPRDFQLAIPHPRANAIYHELKALPVNDFTNAAAVLTRVFLEVSVEHLLNREKLKFHAFNDSP
ncbi:MAG TPA: hypothetical protein DEX10_04875 [Betaproteobacteria bacterium]|nr:hypothetical protein [Betaproteobacteria bacterium]